MNFLIRSLADIDRIDTSGCGINTFLYRIKGNPVTAAAVTVAIPSFVPVVAITAVITPTLTELAVTVTVAAFAGAVNLPVRPVKADDVAFGGFITYMIYTSSGIFLRRAVYYPPVSLLHH